LPFYLSFFSYVEQKTHLFHLSVSENVSMGWHNVPEKLVRDAVGKVGMHEAVTKLPQGYATVLGERGVNLSGGQAQRLALARAIIRDPAILVLDEFTSALDRELEDEIIEDLFANSATRTLICVTHSPTLASRFDRIISLEAL
jgi:ABC-type multidrug transport system fused ATPase/permease subunit